MFCIECGSKIEENSNFCNKCGSKSEGLLKKYDKKRLGQGWLLRLAKVVYILLFIPAILVVILVWSSNKPYYSTYSHTYHGSSGEAFWYSLLALVISILVLKAIKIGFLYIALGEKPDWKQEIKRPY